MSDRYIKYYLMYLKNDGSLYAYTTSKKEYHDFMKFRFKDIFKVKKVELNYDERLFLSEEHARCRLKLYYFEVGNHKFNIMLTYAEYLNVSSSIIQFEINMASKAIINPRIFNDKIYKYLDIVRYTSAYNNYANGEIIIDSLTDELTVFLKMNNNTVNLNAIYEEVISCTST